jgi:hypothetical protein
VFVSDVLIAPLLFANTSSAANAESAEARDVSATAMALAQLVQLEHGTANAELPEPLSHALSIATRSQGGPGYAAFAEFIAALSELDEALVATDEEVGREIERVMGATSEWRRQRIEMLQRSPGQGEPAEPEATRVFRVAPREARAEDGRRNEEATVIFSKPPEPDLSQQETLSTPKAAPSDSEATISAVWREARAVMDSPRGGTRRARKPTPRLGLPAATAEPVPEPAPIAEQAAAQPSTAEPASDVGSSLRTFVIAILVTLAVSGALYAAFGSHTAAPAAPPHSSNGP